MLGKHVLADYAIDRPARHRPQEVGELGEVRHHDAALADWNGADRQPLDLPYARLHGSAEPHRRGRGGDLPGHSELPRIRRVQDRRIGARIHHENACATIQGRLDDMVPGLKLGQGHRPEAEQAHGVIDRADFSRAIFDGIGAVRAERVTRAESQERKPGGKSRLHSEAMSLAVDGSETSLRQSREPLPRKPVVTMPADRRRPLTKGCYLPDTIDADA